MILYPAIDLKEGACVRLQQGDMALATQYDADPARRAAEFEAEGAQFLHVVDLDGAFAGESRNSATVEKIIEAVSIPLQLGGGVRSLEQIERWIKRGVRRVVLGTMAIEEQDKALEACRLYKEQLALALDIRDNALWGRGWKKREIGGNLQNFVLPFVEAGVGALIVTDIERDGMMTSPNFLLYEEFSRTMEVEVIASGGVARLEDIARLADSGSVAGVICGRALYEKKFSLKQALRAAEARGETTC